MPGLGRTAVSLPGVEREGRRRYGTCKAPAQNGSYFPQSFLYASRYPAGSQDDLLSLLSLVVMWAGAT